MGEGEEVRIKLPPGKIQVSSKPGTPAEGSSRQRRSFVGFTNRPKSNAGRPQQADGEQDHPLGNTLDTATFNITQPYHNSSSVRPHTSSGGMRGTFSRPSEFADPYEKSVRRQTRDKILMKRLNLRPLLNKSSADGYIRSSELRKALNDCRIELNEEQMRYATGTDKNDDDYVDIRLFLESLVVPNFEDYDPFGQSVDRERRFLATTAFRPRNRVDSNRSLFDTDAKADQNSRPNSRPSNPATPAERFFKRETHSNDGRHRLARSYAQELNKKMKEQGVSILEMFRKLDKDSSGIIEKSEFESVLGDKARLGLLQEQINGLWNYMDKDESNTINYLELMNAIQENSSDRAPSSFVDSRQMSRPSSQGGGLSFANPWASGRAIRSPILPTDHFNVRTYRRAPPRTTAESFVPEKESFHFAPDWMRYHAVTLNNPTLTAPTGSQDVKKRQYEARLERRRRNQARIENMVEQREFQAEDMDAARISGLSRTRLAWMSNLKPPWA